MTPHNDLAQHTRSSNTFIHSAIINTCAYFFRLGLRTRRHIHTRATLFALSTANSSLGRHTVPRCDQFLLPAFAALVANKLKHLSIRSPTRSSPSLSSIRSHRQSDDTRLDSNGSRVTTSRIHNVHPSTSSVRPSFALLLPTPLPSLENGCFHACCVECRRVDSQP